MKNRIHKLIILVLLGLQVLTLNACFSSGADGQIAIETGLSDIENPISLPVTIAKLEYGIDPESLTMALAVSVADLVSGKNLSSDTIIGTISGRLDIPVAALVGVKVKDVYVDTVQATDGAFSYSLPYKYYNIAVSFVVFGEGSSPESETSVSSPVIVTISYNSDDGELLMTVTVPPEESSDGTTSGGDDNVVVLTIVLGTSEKSLPTTTVSTWYRDDDGDGYGLSTSSTTSATQPTGYVSDSTDCDDASAAINPVATETCDGFDNDCDGTSDEEFTTGLLYLDLDADGYGDPLLTTETCYNADGTARAGYSTDNTDCDDSVATIHENCMIDDDCTKAGATACSTYTVPDTIATCDGDGDATNDTDVTDELNAWIETIPNGTEEEYSIVNLDGKCFAVKSAVKLDNRNNITIEGNGGTLQAIDYATCSMCTYPPNADHGGTYTGSRVTTSDEWTTALATATADPNDASYKSRSQFSIELGSGFKVQNLTIQGTLARTFDTDGDGDDEDATVNLLFDSARETDHNVTLAGPTNVTIDNVTFKNAWGNTVQVSGSSSSSVAWTDATDVTIKNSFIDGAGQRALSCAGCFNFTVQDTDIRNIGYTVVYIAIENGDDDSHGDISLIRNTIGPFKNNILSAGVGQTNDSTIGPFVLQDNIQEAATPYSNNIPIMIGYNSIPVSLAEFTGNTIKGQGVATFKIQNAEEVLISGNNTSQLNFHAAYLKNVAEAVITNNTFTGAWGIAWFKDADGADSDATTANTTCTNNTMIGVVNNAIPFGRWTNGDTTYGDVYLIDEGCETFECRLDWDGNGSLDYTDC